MTEPGGGPATPQTDERANADAMRAGSVAAADDALRVEMANTPLTTGNLDLAVWWFLQADEARALRGILTNAIETAVSRAVRDELERCGVIAPRERSEPMT